MKKFSVGLCALLFGSSVLFAAPNDAKSATKSSVKSSTKSSTKSADSGSGFAFAGVGLGLGGGAYAFGVSLGALGGYHYYFPSSIQLSNYRHGVRGYGALDWAYYGLNLIFVRAGADYVIDFTPNDRFVWGAFAGLQLGAAIGGGSGAFGWGVNIGGSLELQNKHRFEVALGYGFNLLNLRYIYKF